jgi:catechol 2,3-dioxygenase-like lactoylglutathione lyase family enzyme
LEQTAPLEIGLPVIDLDLMLDFYTSVLACAETRRSDIAAELSRGLTTAEGGYVNVWLKTPGGEVVKLMRPTPPPARSSSSAFLAERTGVAYLTFYCSNLAEVLAKAEARGAVLRSDRGLISGEIGIKLCFFEDPEGNVIELVETL